MFAFCFHQKNYPRIFFFVRKDKTGFDILTARRQIQRCFSLQSLSRPGFSPLIFPIVTREGLRGREGLCVVLFVTAPRSDNGPDSAELPTYPPPWPFQGLYQLPPRALCWDRRGETMAFDTKCQLTKLDSAAGEKCLASTCTQILPNRRKILPVGTESERGVGQLNRNGHSLVNLLVVGKESSQARVRCHLPP